MANITWTPTHTKLRDALAPMYLDKDSALRIAVESGIDPTLVKFSDNAANNWYQIIQEADAQGVLIPLVERAIGEHKTNETLKEVLDSLKKGGGIPPRAQTPQEILPPISDLQLRDFINEYFSKRDIADMLLRVTEALRQAGKIPERTNIEIDTFSSTSEPVSTIALEMVKYFRRRIWTSFLITAAKESNQDAFREKFGGGV